LSTARGWAIASVSKHHEGGDGGDGPCDSKIESLRADVNDDLIIEIDESGDNENVSSCSHIHGGQACAAERNSDKDANKTHTLS
jgi:hypothetical protein